MVKTKGYFVISVCKDEGKSLPKLIESIEKQTVKPVLWAISDDGSTDGTSEIIEEAKRKHNWIQSLTFNGSVRDRGVHLSQLIIKTFDYGVQYCNKAQISYEYMANIDGDMILEPSFFETLIVEFEQDRDLGVICGGVYHFKAGKLVRANARESEPSGGDMVIRKTCFEDCEGILISFAWDSVLNTKAKLRGWKTKRFENVKAIEIRDTGTAEGYWKGYVRSGQEANYLNLNPLHALLKGIMLLFINPYYIGFAYLSGYFRSVIKKREQIDDREIRHYFRYVRPKELIRYYIEMLKTKFTNNQKKD